MSLYSMLAGRGPSGFGYGSSAEQVTEGLSLSGKSFLVTGCGSGIGRETARVLALRGARVIGTGRTLASAERACAALEGRALPLACELSEPNSVRSCVESVKRQGFELDGIICNAGIMALPTLQRALGYELQFFTNHVGHFLLVTGLLETLSTQGRVVMVSSAFHKRAPAVGIDFDNLRGEGRYTAWEAYGRSKFANVLFAKHLARRFAGTARTANAVHPGVVRTELQRHMPGLAAAAMTAAGPIFLKNVGQGAATQVYAAAHPDAARISGQYLANCNVSKARPDTDDVQLAERLWKVSEQIASLC
ncbi:MAG TPA: SDR family oxidoreductase [Polyangiaceae bacterium]|nr:SDR family oxidoreductase [Polyangiaceae bacterium]